MDKLDVDVAIIGAGTAGMVAYRQVSKHSDSVVIIEDGSYGTTCARVGCMPSKLLIAAAETAQAVRDADTFGVRAGSVVIDGQAVMQRVREERDRFVAPVVRSMEALPQAHRLRGHARFLDQQRLVVGNHTEVRASRIVIATGSRPVVPGVLEGAKDRLVINDDVFDWQDLPDSVAVFGPGVIGLELGQALARLGVQVRLFGLDGSIGGIQDEAVQACARELFAEELALSLSAETRSVRRTDEGVSVAWEEGGDEHQATFDYVLAATGRRPNIDRLDIQNAGVELDERGMPLFDPYTLRCGQSPVFLAGDANNDRPLLHEAADEGRIAGRNAAHYPDIRAGARSVPLSVVFSDPQIARVGWTLAEASSRCETCVVAGEVSFSGQGRSRVIGKNRGLLRVYAEHGSGRFLGAEMLGPAAEHLAHLLAWSLEQRLGVGEMLAMPFYHPVIEEGLRTALRDVHGKLEMGPQALADCMDCGPGA